MTVPCESEDRIDDIDKEIHKQSGWFKAAASFGGLCVMALGSFNGIVLSKLNSIETLLTTNQVTIAELRMFTQSLDQRLKEIEERHKWLDQNGQRTTVTRRGP